MQYKDFQGLSLSRLGMGNMRLPASVPRGPIDTDKAEELIDYVYHQGINYFDTAYGYLSGKSEEFVGRVLAGVARERYYLATKLPMWKITCEDDLEAIFNEELRRLNTDYIDVYLLHSLNAGSIEIIRKYHVLEFLDRKKAEGKIRFAAFSFHDKLEAFKQLVDLYDFDMCQIQLNILDINEQATAEGMRYAAEKGMAVVIMEPLRGGTLATVPDEVAKLYNEMPVKRSPAEWGFRFMYNFPQVSVILSGVSTMEQLEDNLRIFDGAEAGGCSTEEEELFIKVREAYDARIRVRCTDCKYCQPCPQGVEIPKIFSQYNDLAVFDHVEGNRKRYAKLIEGQADAARCVECGACEAICPQHIAIIEKLKEARAHLEG